jgi:hypothetical protein
MTQPLSHAEFVSALGVVANKRGITLYLVDSKSREQRIQLLHDLLVELGFQAFITSRLSQEDSEVLDRIVNPMKDIAKQARYN